MSNEQTKKRWTEKQLEAITADDKRILVSAAAGSGKTAVLTERIIRKLTDTEHPADISRMLVVTFTKAAATELRERIGAALLVAMAENPHNKHLSRQYMLLGKAKISTIHSFCYDIVRANFQKLGFPCNVRLMDENETDLMSSEIMESVVDHYYNSDEESCDIEDFNSFIDNFTSSRGTDRTDLFISLYKKLESYVSGIDFLLESSDRLDKVTQIDFSETVWGKVISREIADTAKYYNSIFAAACEKFKKYVILLKKYYPSFEHDRDFTERLAFVAEKSFDTLQKEIENYTPVSLKAIPSDMKTQDIVFWQGERKIFTDKIKNLRKKYFSATDEERRLFAEQNADICRKLHKLLSEYNRRLNEEKKRGGVISFADLELLSYKLLYDENGELTDTARSISESYDEIYIDEYQDVNEIQDRIFSAISETGKQFMVGDIKQSIYGFRGAEPSLFAKYRESDDIKTIFLQNNFRCDSPIIDFSNEIFAKLFGCGSDTMNYVPEDQLVFSRLGETKKIKPYIRIFSNFGTDRGDDRTTFELIEAKFIADYIMSYYEPNKFSDIAILIRSKASAVVLEQYLEHNNISYINTETINFFENEEILLMLDLLNAIDNPRRDIYLAGTLKSPLFGFTLDELVRIRYENKDIPLYDALVKYTEAHDFEKGRAFIEKLTEYRKAAASMPSDKLIWMLFSDTAIFSMIYNRNGYDENRSSAQKENLLLLYEYARVYELNGYKGLYHFLSYLSEAIENKTKMKSANTKTDTNSVKIMTIHSSKGLEFPICFLYDAGKAFNTEDLKKSMMLNKSTGLTMKLCDSTGMAKYDTPMRQASAATISDTLREEEMRILYVALTRARDELIITANVKGIAFEYIQKIKESVKSAPADSAEPIKKATSYLDWILYAVLGSERSDELCRIDTSDEDDLLNDIAKDVNELQREEILEATEKIARALREDYDISISGKDGDTIYAFEKLFRERFDYVYPHAYSSLLPAKVSVSKLFPDLLDEYEDTALLESAVTGKSNAPRMKKPRFLEETQQASAADIGTATHVFMQFCNFEYVEEHGIEAELRRLIDEEFISQSIGDLISIPALEGFFSSSLYREMKQARELWREKRFNVKLPASSFTTSAELAEKLRGEEILVQGVIDCLFTDKDGRLVIADYKTDRFTQAELADRNSVEETLRQRHSMQLRYYAEACGYMLGRYPEKLLVYSFALNDTVDITPS